MWQDNSDDEDGFRVVITVDGEPFSFVVGPNVTSFEIPADIREGCGTYDYAVIAFNEAGESRPAIGITEEVDCFNTPDPTSTAAPAVLPTGGTGGSPGGPPSSAVYALIAFAALLVAASVGLRVRRS